MLVKTLLLVSALVGTMAAALWYRRVALRRGIIAKINSRTLHERAVPRGGGIAFGVVFSLAMLVAWACGAVSTTLMLAIGAGGGAAAVAGFVDDLYDTRPLTKFAIQALLGSWLVSVIDGPVFGWAIGGLMPEWRIAIVVTLLFVPVWLMNLYNFIDGIDGMAIIGAVFVCTAALIALFVTGGDPVVVFIFALLGGASLGFLRLNLPPASIFMGDAGSMFLGYCFAALLLVTVGSGDISVWSWIAALGYFVADTTTTGICRVLLVRKWWRGHRSHAYQNLARITGSHAKVTYGVALYHVLWALPMVIWSAMRPASAPLAAILSVAPAMVWTLRFGPLLSKD